MCVCVYVCVCVCMCVCVCVCVCFIACVMLETHHARIQPSKRDKHKDKQEKAVMKFTTHSPIIHILIHQYSTSS